MLKKLYEIIEPSDDVNSILGLLYDIVMLICIISSIIPLAIKSNSVILSMIDKVTVTVFIIDYLLRLITAKMKLNKGIKSYFIYPIQPMAIIDLLSILPSLTPINAGLKVLRLFRMIRVIKVFRSFKIFRYSKNVSRLFEVFKKQSKSLLAVLSMAIFYVFFTALAMFNIEPDTFGNFFDALYWATISLTSVGYGDIAPTSDAGRLFTMMSAFVGVAIIALPSGIITAGYIEVLNDEIDNR